jgi:malate dehydrogenase (oxaloacetate-decarboxylating)
MCFAAAQALAEHVGDNLDAEHILPNMDDWEVFPREAASVAMKAVEQGLARIETTYEQEFQLATKIIQRSRNMTQLMMEKGFIPEAPEDDGDAPAVDPETVKAAY